MLCGLGSKLLLPDFFFKGNMVVMPTVTELRAAATASDEACYCLRSLLGRLSMNDCAAAQSSLSH